VSTSFITPTTGPLDQRSLDHLRQAAGLLSDYEIIIAPVTSNSSLASAIVDQASSLGPYVTVLPAHFDFADALRASLLAATKDKVIVAMDPVISPHYLLSLDAALTFCGFAPGYVQTRSALLPSPTRGYGAVEAHLLAMFSTASSEAVLDELGHLSAELALVPKQVYLREERPRFSKYVPSRHSLPALRLSDPNEDLLATWLSEIGTQAVLAYGQRPLLVLPRSAVRKADTEVTPSDLAHCEFVLLP
jgi:hypothetical protein